MDSQEKFIALEERIRFLEEKLSNISFGDNNSITISSCSFGTAEFGDNCDVCFQNSTAGSVINCEFDDAEDKLDEIESRIDDVESRIEDLESQIDELDPDIK